MPDAARILLSPIASANNQLALETPATQASFSFFHNGNDNKELPTLLASVGSAIRPITKAFAVNNETMKSLPMSLGVNFSRAKPVRIWTKKRTVIHNGTSAIRISLC